MTTPDGIYVDGTFGRGGHSRAILERLSTPGAWWRSTGIPQAVQSAREAAATSPTIRASRSCTPASPMPAALAGRGIEQVHGVLLDLGVSSPQIDDPARGFQFRFDGPLDMRMDPTRGESAADFLGPRRRAPHRRGDTRLWGRTVCSTGCKGACCSARKRAPCSNHGELSEVVAGAVKTREAGQNPATRTFQALRIFVNAELEELEQGLSAALELLVPGGRLVVISFHSLEDRIVKTFIAKREQERVRPARALRRAEAARGWRRSRGSSPGRPRPPPIRAPARP